MPHIVTPDGLAERPSRLRSPAVRAIVPVLGGALLLGTIMGVTWLIAAFISGGGGESTERLAPPTFDVGDVERVAASVAEDGPILFPGLNTTTGERTLVLDHEGADPARGWRVYWAYPADRDASCPVEQVEGSARFVDCDGREIAVTALALPDGVNPVVENQRRLSIDLRSSVTPVPDTSP